MTIEDSFLEEDVDLDNPDDFDEENFADIRSMIAPDMEMQGNLNLRHGIEIQGKFTGKIHSNSKIIIKEQGILFGDINALHVVVEGNSQSKIIAKKKLEVLKNGTFIGILEIQPEIIVLSEFATFGTDETVANQFANEYKRTRKTGTITEDLVQ